MKLFEIVRKDEIIGKAMEMARHYPLSLLGGIKNKRLFNDLETYFMFIGYPRSGHSLMGSLLDAHPDMIVAHELNTLKYLYAGFRKDQLRYLLLNNSRLFTQAGRKWGKYAYKVPNQWQGKFRKLKIIGDKKGLGSTLVLSAYPEMLRKLYNTFDDVNIKFIHVTRNPYDNITTISRKEKKGSPDLTDSIDYYFSLCETVAGIKKQVKGSDFFEIRHEAFIDAPGTCLKEICTFLGTDAPNDYLNDCSGIVFKSPRKTRHSISWDSDAIELVKKRIAGFPFLKGYSFED